MMVEWSFAMLIWQSDQGDAFRCRLPSQHPEYISTGRCISEFF